MLLSLPWSRRAVSLFSLLALVSCSGHKQPPDQNVRDAVQAALPKHLALQKIETDYTPSEEGTCSVRIRGKLISTESLYVRYEEPPAAAYPELAEIERSLSDRASSDLGLPDGNPYTARMAVLNQQFRDCARGLIEEVTKGNHELPFEGRAEFTYEFKEWQVKQIRLQPAPETLGRPRHEYPKNALIVGTAEALKKIEALGDDVEEVDALLETTRAEVEKQKEHATQVAAAALEKKMSALVDEVRGAQFVGEAANMSVTPARSAKIRLAFGRDAVRSAESPAGHTWQELPLTITLLDDPTYLREYRVRFMDDEEEIAQKKFFGVAAPELPAQPWRAWPMDSGAHILFRLEAGGIKGVRQSLSFHVITASRLP